MHIERVAIENFRGIASAEIEFSQHALLVGPNNACKSTILEALNLVLGPDRVSGVDVIDEHDFFQGNYRPEVSSSEGGEQDTEAEEENENGELQTQPEDTDDDTPEGDHGGHHDEDLPQEQAEVEEDQPEIRIEVTLTGLSDADRQRFRNHLDVWNHEESRLYTAAELNEHEPNTDEFVLRVGFRGWYETEEDEFRAETYFLNPEPVEDGDYDHFGRKSKQHIGFLYLRSLRTGSRAASLERGSLLDVLLREKTSRPQLWETILDGLKETGRALEANDELRQALNEIQGRIEALIPLAEQREPASTLRPSRMTRRHLRQVMTYFLASRDSEHPLPFDRLGSGTSNVLVFALLSAIAEAKDNVVFAMEEPEIALPPHTQRVVIHRLKEMSAQAIVSSHSPYVGELFLPDALVVVKRSDEGSLDTSIPVVGHGVKEKTLRRDFRTRFAEGLLARSVVIVEGLTEFWAIPAGVDVLAKTDGTRFHSFDRDGLVFIPASGSGELEGLAEYFGSLGIPPLVVCDELPAEERPGVQTASESLIEHTYAGFERLVAEELGIGVIQRIAGAWTDWHDYPWHLAVPEEDADENEWREYFFEVLRTRKGAGYAERVLSRCSSYELPGTLVNIIAEIRSEVDREPLPEEDSLYELFGNNDGEQPDGA